MGDNYNSLMSKYTTDISQPCGSSNSSSRQHADVIDIVCARSYLSGVTCSGWQRAYVEFSDQIKCPWSSVVKPKECL